MNSRIESLEALTTPEVLGRTRDHGDEAEAGLPAAEDTEWRDLSHEQWLGKNLNMP